MERLLLAGLWNSDLARQPAVPPPALDGVREEEESFYSAESSMLEVLDVCGVSEEPFAQFEEVSEIPARPPGDDGDDLTVKVRKVGQRLMAVESNRKGGSQEFRDLSQQLVELVGKMPDTALREPVLGCLHDMQKNFMGKTKGTWQPQLKQALKLIGPE
eukprot:s223_g39.t1